MRKISVILISILFIISCGENNVRKTESNDQLKIFFNLCVSDIVKAKKVIVDNDLVKNLSHLQNMDHGGKKYYLLERESITKMLKSVTEGLYADYILINKPGYVIYSMSKDEYFGKSVKGALKNTALKKCHANHDLDFYIDDSFLTSERDDEVILYFSSTIQGGNTNPGILVLEIDPQKIIEITGKKSRIISSAGKILISEDKSETGKNFIHFDQISTSPDYNKTYSFKKDRVRYSYRFFKYMNIEWIILNEL